MTKLLKNIFVISFIGIILFSYHIIAYADSVVEKSVKEMTIDGVKVVSVPYEKINSIVSDAKRFIDEGKTLYISSPECSNEELADLFSIPKDDTTIYNSLVLLATSIYRLNDIYIFENHYGTFGFQQNIISSKKKSFHDKVITVREKNFSGELNFILNPEESIDIAIKSQKSTIDFVNQLNNNSIFPSYIYTASTEIYTLDGKRIGYTKVVQSNVDIGYIIVNEQRQYVYDLITKFEVFPDKNIYVTNYMGRMHCNITGHTSLESNNITLVSPYNNSINGMYDVVFQKIIDSSPVPNVYDWIVKPKNINFGKNYNFTSKICVATTNSSGSRGGFSSMFINCYMFGMPISKFSFEIGGWF